MHILVKGFDVFGQQGRPIIRTIGRQRVRADRQPQNHQTQYQHDHPPIVCNGQMIPRHRQNYVRLQVYLYM